MLFWWNDIFFCLDILNKVSIFDLEIGGWDYIISLEIDYMWYRMCVFVDKWEGMKVEGWLVCIEFWSFVKMVELFIFYIWCVDWWEWGLVRRLVFCFVVWMKVCFIWDKVYYLWFYIVYLCFVWLFVEIILIIYLKL